VVQLSLGAAVTAVRGLLGLLFDEVTAVAPVRVVLRGGLRGDVGEGIRHESRLLRVCYVICHLL
jgi:hypothetical protein